MRLTILEHDSVSHDGDISLDPVIKLGSPTAVYGRIPQEQVAALLRDSEGVIVNKTLINREVLSACPKLRYVGLFATGYNNIDLTAAAEFGVTVCNAPGYSTDSVAQLVFSYILNFATKLERYGSSVKRGDWLACKNFTYFPWQMSELAGKTLGIIGFGAIGRQVARIAESLGMRVIISVKTPREDLPYECADKLALARAADFVTIHTPLTEQTKQMINAEFLYAMKPTAYLINTARGGVIDEHSLADALIAQKIAGAALDVLTVEPMNQSSPLASAMSVCEDLVITPHIAWATVDARRRLIDIVAQNLSDYINGSPKNTVNLR